MISYFEMTDSEVTFSLSRQHEKFPRRWAGREGSEIYCVENILHCFTYAIDFVEYDCPTLRMIHLLCQEGESCNFGG